MQYVSLSRKKILQYSKIYIQMYLTTSSHINAITPRLYSDIPGNDNTKDKLDDFTNKLIQSKGAKWLTLNVLFAKNRKKLNAVIRNEATLESLSKDQLEDLILKDIKFQVYNGRTVKLISDLNIMLSYPKLCILLSICADNGDRANIETLTELHRCRLTEKQLDFCKIFAAEALWIQGDVNESIKIYRCLYSTYDEFRRDIRTSLEHLIFKVIEMKSEAVLVQMINFTSEIGQAFGDYASLIRIWQTCFLSDWYSDQQMAFDMFEESAALRDEVKKSLFIISGAAIQLHKIEVLQRFIEILLRLQWKKYYTGIVQQLFDYHCYEGHMQQCSEIVKWCNRQNVELRNDQKRIYLELYLKLPVKKPSRAVNDQLKPFKFKF